MSKAPSKARRSDAKSSPQRTLSPQKSLQKTGSDKPKAAADKPKAAADKQRTEVDSTIKATFYLTQDTVNGLEDAWLHLRRTVVTTQRGAITKSLIVRLALEIALEEITTKGPSSQLVKRLDQR